MCSLFNLIIKMVMKMVFEIDIIHEYESFKKIKSLNHVIFKHVQARDS